MKNIKHLILVGIIILLIYILIPSAENPKQDFTIPWEIEFLGQEINIQKLDLASQELWVKHLMVEGFNSYQLRLYLYRSQQYFPFIEQYLSENNLPEDLKYLAVAESALRPTAHSHAGAAGIWQFMPGTAQDYNLSITSTIDERLHFEKATVSAISYIQKLYNRFNDYYLALAAYNVGQ
ncbi:MAG: lytic transglycosylase domain-containing protein [Patescibacteria group bacterium]|nr:lytic transglycosylase domain-containing protein [Patescibacteria group bacterium]